MSLKAKAAIWSGMLLLTATVIGLPFTYWAGWQYWEGGYPLVNAIVWWVIFGLAMGWIWYQFFQKDKQV